MAGRWRKRRGVVGTPTGEEHGEQGPANDGDAVQVWRERRLLQRFKFLHRLSDNNWFDLTVSFANRLATCHNGGQVFNCQTMKTSSCRAHFTKHFTKQKQRAIQKRSKRFEWPLVVYYNQSVKSHSCYKVNSDISPEVALMLIKSEETTGSGWWIQLPPTSSNTSNTPLHTSFLHFPPTALVSRVYIMLPSRCSLRLTRGVIGRKSSF